MKQSILFQNTYGFGETHSTVYSALTGNNIYKNYADAWYIFNSFKQKSNLGKYYKEKGFYNIYYRNCTPNNTRESFYGRWFKSLTYNFDKKKFKKINNKDTFQKFVNINKFKQNDLLFVIHDYSLHDNKLALQGYEKDHLKAAEQISHVVKKNLKSINYNPKIDTLFFLSDHGLTPTPNSCLFSKNEVTKKDYDSFYNKILIDEKIKMLFFIKGPNIKKKIIIKNKIRSNDIFKIIKLYNEKTLKKLIKELYKITRNKLIISLRATRATVYESKIDKYLYHSHILKIEGNKKLIYSHKHPKKYLYAKNDKFKVLNNKIKDKELIEFLDNYFSIKNKIIKFNLLILSLIFLITKAIITFDFNKLRNLIKRVFN